MSHLVESMAYVGQTPWHGLGKQLSEAQPIEVWAREAGMDWEILSSPVNYVATKPGVHLGALSTFTESRVLYRSDNQQPLSVVSNRYKVVQPRDILEFYRDLTEISGFQLETAGVLKGGRKLWALASTGQDFSLAGNDLTKAYVLLATACDGTLATTAQFTSVRVVCNNTLAVALGEGRGAVKVPHSTHFDAQAVKQQLGISVSSWDQFMYQMKTLSQRKVTTQEAETFLRTVYQSPQKAAEQTRVKASERSMAASLALFNGAGQGATLSSAQNTAYGLLNSVTEFVDHQRRARSQDNRLDSAWFGQGAQIKQNAYQAAMALVA